MKANKRTKWNQTYKLKSGDLHNGCKLRKHSTSSPFKEAAGQSSGISFQHFKEKFVHHHTTIFLEVEPKLLGQQLDMSNRWQEEKELPQTTVVASVAGLDAFDEGILQFVLKSSNSFTWFHNHICTRTQLKLFSLLLARMRCTSFTTFTINSTQYHNSKMKPRVGHSNICSQ